MWQAQLGTKVHAGSRTVVFVFWVSKAGRRERHSQQSRVAPCTREDRLVATGSCFMAASWHAFTVTPRQLVFDRRVFVHRTSKWDRAVSSGPLHYHMVRGHSRFERMQTAIAGP
jgi:hypothetical protein